MVWELKKLSDVVEIISGGTPKSGVSEYWADEVPWITPKDMGSVKDRFVFDTNRKISNLGLAKSSAKLIPENSVILSTRAPIGHLVINTVPMATNQGCRGLVVSDKITTNFLYYFLKSNVSLLNDLGTGTTFKELSKTALSAVHILVPHVEEQKRIVAILDEALEQIDQAKANAEQNLKDARELFESYLQSVFDNDNDGWDEKPIQDITELVTKGSSPNWQGINYVEKGGIFFLTSKNVGAGKLLLNNKRYLESEFNEIQSKSILKKGDVLTNIVGASIGRTAIFNLDEVTNINQAVCLIRCVPNKVYNYYLMYLLNSPFFKKVLHDNEVDNARANLSLTFFKNLVVPLPCLAKQKEIVENIQQVLIKTKSLEAIYQQKITALDELKQSLFQKAFSGELTQPLKGDAA